LIARLAVRLGEKMSKFGGCGAGIGGGAEMGAGSQPIDISEQRVVKVARCKRAIASEDFLAIALSTIEGISRPVANTIAAKFNGSVLELATQINADPDATHTKIRNIEHAKSGRKIAGKIADKIIERFSSRTEPTAE
jgi:ribosomal protein S13